MGLRDYCQEQFGVSFILVRNCVFLSGAVRLAVTSTKDFFFLSIFEAVCVRVCARLLVFVLIFNLLDFS